MPNYFVSRNRLSNLASIEDIKNDVGVDLKIDFFLEDTDGYLLATSGDVDRIATHYRRSWNSVTTIYDHIRNVNFSAENETVEPDQILEIEVPEMDAEDYEEMSSGLKVDIHENWDGLQQQEFMDKTRQILLPILRKDVLISVPHGFTLQHEYQKDRLSEDESTFEIHIWSAKSGERSKEPPAKMYGIKLPCNDDAFLPTGNADATEITTPEGWVIAELYENQLFIHHDICHTGEDVELLLYERLLKEVVKIIDTPDLAEKRKAEEYRKNVKNFVSICLTRQTQEYKQIKNTLEDVKVQIEAHSKNLSQALEQRESLREKLDTFQPQLESNTQKFQQQYEQLINIVDVTKVRFPSKGRLLIYTKPLYCTDTRTEKEHEIGEFKITVDIEEKRVTWKNLTRLVKNAYNSEGMQAPHIYVGGNPCYGNVEEAFTKYLATYDFYPLVILAIKFVQSANTSDAAGKYVNKWPLREDAEKERNKKEKEVADATD